MDKRLVEQLSIDFNTSKDNIVSDVKVVTDFRRNKSNSKWVFDDISGMMLTTRTNNVIACVPDYLKESLEEYIKLKEYAYDLFTSPSIYLLNNIFEDNDVDCKAVEVFEYWVNTSNKLLKVPKTEFKLRKFKNFNKYIGDNDFYNVWLDGKRKQDNRFGYEILDKDKVIGACGVSGDSEYFWQLGLNVLPEYRGRGLGEVLVKSCINECKRLKKYPIYAIVPSNISSKRLAMKCNLKPEFFIMYIDCVY